MALTAAAGSLDAVTFAFNEVFASTMTGNLILLGLDTGRGRCCSSWERPWLQLRAPDFT